MALRGAAHTVSCDRYNSIYFVLSEYSSRLFYFEFNNRSTILSHGPVLDVTDKAVGGSGSVCSGD
jgi:hypothetical protein